MPSKNNLSVLKRSVSKSILPANDTARKGRAGRKPLPKGAKQHHKVTLSLDDAEWAKLHEKAGLIKKATVIHTHLRKTGFFD